MIIIKEKSSFQESEMLTFEQFSDRLQVVQIRSIILNAGTAILTVNTDRKNTSVGVGANNLIISCNGHDLRLAKKDIKGIESTSSCFYVKTRLADVWLNK